MRNATTTISGRVGTLFIKLACFWLFAQQAYGRPAPLADIDLTRSSTDETLSVKSASNQPKQVPDKVRETLNMGLGTEK